jgi:Glyoxalase/Bleomycin resistance protein/Dioxygenase superfamily
MEKSQYTGAQYTSTQHDNLAHEDILCIHHVTAIASDPQKNIDFYSQILGLRLVKLTVNFDDPTTYHPLQGYTKEDMDKLELRAYRIMQNRELLNVVLYNNRVNQLASQLFP